MPTPPKKGRTLSEWIGEVVRELRKAHPNWSRRRLLAAAYSMAREKGFEVPDR